MTEETKIDNETMTIRRNKDESTQNYKTGFKIYSRRTASRNRCKSTKLPMLILIK